VRRNRGAGIDRLTIAQVELFGVDRLLDKLADSLKQGSCRHAGCGSQARVDRARTAVGSRCRRPYRAGGLKLVIGPIFEADMLSCSFGFRPKKTAHDALQVLIDEAWRGRRWVAETDIASCFESIPHDRLAAVEEQIVDRQVLKLLRAMLRAGVMEAGVVKAA
jgi:RNA-directed DNA polymerase